MKLKFYCVLCACVLLGNSIKSFSQANISLSNLASATAINHSLVAGTNNSLSLGSSAIGWKNLYLTTGVYLNGNLMFATPLKTNIAIGARALYKTTANTNLIAIGDSALFNNTTASRVTAIGSFALYKNTTGDNNTALGYQSLYNTTTGNSNVANGMQALYENTTGSNNIAGGAKALYANTSGYSNIAFGIKALYSNITGNQSVAIGDSTLYVNTGGSNVAVGSKALYSSTSGYSNTGIGYHADVNSSAANATAIGSNAYANCSNCVILGSVSAYNNAPATASVGIGTTTPSGVLNVNGGNILSLANPGYAVIGDISSYNLGIDYYQVQARYNGTYTNLQLNPWGGTVYAGNGVKSVYGLVAYGSTDAIYANTSTGTAVAAYGHADGVYAYTDTGKAVYAYTNNGYAGYFYNKSGVGVEGYDAGGYNEGVYGYEGGVGVGVFGEADVQGGYGVSGVSANDLGVYGRTGNSAEYGGFFVGDVYSSGNYVGSDEKLKQNIKDMTSAMSIINQLKPKHYNYRQDSNYKLMNLPQGQHYGLIAQDVEKLLPGVVKTSRFDVDKAIITPEEPLDSSHTASLPKRRVARTNEVINFKAVNYTELIPIIIKGMQEMNASKDSALKQQQQVNANLQSQIDELKAMIADLSTANNQQSTVLSSASLAQNVPNPFTSSTSISYSIPQAAASAQIIITDIKGVVLKQVNLSAKGKGNINVDASTLAAGAYQYSLYVNNKLIDTKQMVSAK